MRSLRNIDYWFNTFFNSQSFKKLIFFLSICVEVDIILVAFFDWHKYATGKTFIYLTCHQKFWVFRLINLMGWMIIEILVFEGYVFILSFWKSLQLCMRNKMVICGIRTLFSGYIPFLQLVWKNFLPLFHQNK